MPLTTADKSAIKPLAAELKSHAELWGAEALARLFLNSPSAKTYFHDFHDYTAKGSRVKTHGGKVLSAVAGVCDHLDDVAGHLDQLAVKHGEVFLVDPHNFPLLAQCILVTLASNKKVFTPELHCALDKFLTEISIALSSRYR